MRLGAPAHPGCARQDVAGPVPTSRQREDVVGRVVVVQRQADLLQVVDALGAAGGLAGRLHGGQQQADQDPDDRDDHQQLDQRESALLVGVGSWHGHLVKEKGTL